MDTMIEHEDDLPTDDTTVGSVYESIETNLWLAEAYFARKSDAIGVECLKGAWQEYVRFRDLLGEYSGEELETRLIQSLVKRAGPMAAELALGTDPASENLRKALAAVLAAQTTEAARC
jgi:hypothetical protein